VPSAKPPTETLLAIMLRGRPAGENDHRPGNTTPYITAASVDDDLTPVCLKEYHYPAPISDNKD